MGGMLPVPRLPAIMLRALEDEGHPLDDLLAGTDVTREELYSAGAETSWSDFRTIVGNALRLTGNPSLGLWYGRQLKLASMGLLGFAAISSPTLAEAATLLTRYAALRVQHIRAELEYLPVGPDEDLVPSVRIDEVANHNGIREFLTEAAIRFFADAARLCAGDALTGLRFDVNYDEPDYWKDVDFEYPVRFGMPVVRIYADSLFTPLVQGDRAAMRAMEQMLEQQLELEQGQRSLVARARDALGRVYRAQSQDLPAASEMARLLGCSLRSFRRALADEDTNYRAILSEFRREQAEQALIDGNASVSSIGARLGYRDEANFRRAFRRWTGKSPGAFRAEHQVDASPPGDA